MAREVYYVVLHDEQWRISYGGRHYGAYASQAEALSRAIEAANVSGMTQRDGAEVVVQGEDRQFRTEWTYGKDVYPLPE